MARPLRIEYPGAIYHVCCRMLGSRDAPSPRLFQDTADRQRFLKTLGESVEAFGVRLYLYTLMRNHFHLLLETPQANVSRFMQRLSTAYTVYYNRRHNRHGHLLDGRYKAKLVAGDEYLLKLSRYIHQNPVWVGAWANKPIRERITYLRKYRWSTYPGYIGQSKLPEWVTYVPILAMMDGAKRDQPRHYRQFVESGLAQSDDELVQALHASPLGIGNDQFLRWIDHLRGKKIGQMQHAEDVSFRKVVEPLAAELVIQKVAEVMGVEEEAFQERRRNSCLRAVVCKYLIRYAGLNQREVAQRLGMTTGGAVSAQVKGLPARIDKDRRLRHQTKRIEQLLEAERSGRVGRPRKRRQR